MKLKELKQKLNELPAEYDDKEVVMSSDEEGNSIHPVYDVFTESKEETTKRVFIWPLHDYIDL